MRILVPEWFQSPGFNLGLSSTMDLRSKRLEPILFFLLYVAVGSIFLGVLTDWVSFAVDEGFTSYGAQRLREGEWPHRDFFFLWTPGILVWHAFLQELGFSWLGERASALVAAAFTGALLLRQAHDWNFRATQRALLALGILLWGFSLWNIPYSSWYALPFALLGARLGPTRSILAGLCLAAAFWFKQNIGILACVGSLSALYLAGEKKKAWRVGMLFALGLAIPFAAIFIFGGEVAFTRAFSQIFLFPLRYPALMSEWPQRQWFASPLMLFGLWILGLFSLRPNLVGGAPRLLRIALVLFLGYAAFFGGQIFFLGSFLLFSCLAWGLSLGVALTLPAEEKKSFWLYFLPALGAFLQVFPRVDFQHFLFVFPPAFILWIWSIEKLRLRYPWLRGGLLFIPILVLLWGGFFFQSRLISLRAYGVKDSLGMISYGWAHRMNNELAEVIHALEARGLKRGDPILVLPNATSFYRVSGFRNPTAHNQFFPGYVEAFGESPVEVLAGYEKAGGRYLVWQYKSGLKNPPAIEKEISENYRMLEQFPEHFSVWERKTAQAPIH
ncbi:MAG: hypothetical protein AB7K68_07535 [Bacteriovoracia bacterium]